MELLGWIVVGLLAGVMGELTIPGYNPGGIIATLLVGSAGALLARFVVGLLEGTQATQLSIWTILWGSLGTLTLLVVYRLITNLRRGT